MKRSIWIMAGLTASILAGCAEEDVILPGKREDLRAPFEAAGAEAATEAKSKSNERRAIKLPGVTRNANWTQRIGTPATRTAHPALAQRLTGVQWSVPIGEGDSRRHRLTADPVVGDGRIFTLDAKAQVSAVSTAGSLLWTHDLTPARDASKDSGGGGLAYADGTLYVSSGFGKLVALDAASGTPRWEQDLMATATTAPSVSRGLVYVVAGDSLAWALDAKTGKVAWQLDGSSTGGNVSGGAAPAVSDDLVVFSFGSGALQAAFRKGGLRRWDASLAGQRRGFAINTVSDITGDPVIVGDKIYVGSHQGRIIALNAGNGARLWTAKDGALGPVWPAGDSIFAVSDRNELLRLDASSGAQIWSSKLPGFVKKDRRRRVEIVAHYGPVVAGGRVIVASNDGFVRSFDPVSGQQISAIEVPGGATSNPVVAGGTLYIVSSKGVLHALR